MIVAQCVRRNSGARAHLREKLKDAYPVLFTSHGGLNAHEFILDLRPFKKDSPQARSPQGGFFSSERWSISWEVF